MKKLFALSYFLIFQVFSAYSQEVSSEDLSKLGKVYKNNHFGANPSKKFVKQLSKDYPSSLKQEISFLQQLISENNKLLTDKYLHLPSEVVLKNLYMIREVNILLFNESNITPVGLVDSLKNVSIPRNELIDNYYGMLFTSVGNKNKPFDLSKVDFKLEEYDLKNDTEKGIFFLSAMELCGSLIWGYMNVPNPPNTKEAYSYINKYPKFNGRVYYQYTDLYFSDFELVIDKKEGPQSYKSYYLNKYFETLLYHLLCLKEEGGTQEQSRSLLLNSLLREQKLYKYSKHKEILEYLFKQVN